MVRARGHGTSLPKVHDLHTLPGHVPDGQGDSRMQEIPGEDGPDTEVSGVDGEPGGRGPPTHASEPRREHQQSIFAESHDQETSAVVVEVTPSLELHVRASHTDLDDLADTMPKRHLEEHAGRTDAMPASKAELQVLQTCLTAPNHARTKRASHSRLQC